LPVNRISNGIKYGLYRNRKNEIQLAALNKEPLKTKPK